MPLNPKLQVLCYERRWTILSQVIFAMRENRITPSTLVHELKNINSHLRTKNLESRVSMRLDRRIDEDSPGPNCYDPALYSDRQVSDPSRLCKCPYKRISMVYRLCGISSSGCVRTSLTLIWMDWSEASTSLT